MKPISTLKQHGFFDLGLSLLILAMSGIAVYLTERNQGEESGSLQEDIVIAVTEQEKN
jgi:hypothetical protein